MFLIPVYAGDEYGRENESPAFIVPDSAKDELSSTNTNKWVNLYPNGNRKGSCYMEAGANVPISFITDNLKFRATVAYAYVRNYTKLNYTVFSTGLKYKIPENWGGISIFVNASATTANKKYYKIPDSAGKVKNTVAPKVWLGISKKF